MSENPRGQRYWRNHAELLASLITADNSAVISDFDGTLSAFADRPDGAQIHGPSRDALDRLNRAGVRIALISGRAASDLYSRFARDDVIYYGNHGFERWRGHTGDMDPGEDGARAAINTLLDALDLSDLPGVIAEPKGMTAAIHYRQAPDPVAAKSVIELRLRPLSESLGLKVTPGQMIWDIKPEAAIDKGTALRSVINECHLRSVIFLGDDVTDLVAMDTLRQIVGGPGSQLRGAAIGVFHPKNGPANLGDHCDFFADGIEDAGELLTFLADRTRS